MTTRVVGMGKGKWLLRRDFADRTEDEDVAVLADPLAFGQLRN